MPGLLPPHPRGIKPAAPENTREGSAFRIRGDHTVAKGEYDIPVNVMSQRLFFIDRRRFDD
jgi:hypothetical protein